MQRQLDLSNSHGKGSKTQHDRLGCLGFFARKNSAASSAAAKEIPLPTIAAPPPDNLIIPPSIKSIPASTTNTEPQAVILNGHVMLLNSEIKLEKKIGSGSFSSVYQAQWQQKNVAVKSIVIKDQKDQEHFTNEIKIQKLLTDANAPYTVAYYGYCFANTSTYHIVLQLVNGISLEAMIKQNLPLEFATRYKVTQQITQAVAFMHSKDVIHRDVKTENILFDENTQTAYICDFGFAVIAKEPITSHLIGTPVFIAPEIWQHLPYTNKIDIYSLSILLAELWNWQLAWKNSIGPHDVRTLTLAGERPPLAPDCGAKIAGLIKRCWQNAPHDRPTAKELVEEFRFRP